MVAQKDHCAFCADSDTQRRRRNLYAILRHGGPLCTFLRTVWPALWRQLSTSTWIVYVCRLYFQNLDTGANHRFNLLQRSIATLEQSLASSGYYPLVSRTATIFASVDNDREERKADRFSTACRQRDEHVLSM